jgi:hypothetical protein
LIALSGADRCARLRAVEETGRRDPAARDPGTSWPTHPEMCPPDSGRLPKVSSATELFRKKSVPTAMVFNLSRCRKNPTFWPGSFDFLWYWEWLRCVKNVTLGRMCFARNLS